MNNFHFLKNFLKTSLNKKFTVKILFLKNQEPLILVFFYSLSVLAHLIYTHIHVDDVDFIFYFRIKNVLFIYLFKIIIHNTPKLKMDEYLNQTRKNSFSFNDIAHFLFLLLVCKFLKSFGIYLCYDLLKDIHLVQLLFFSLLIASVFYLILQKPFSSSTNKKLNKFQYFRLLKYCSFQLFIKLLWLFGLTQCGPLRTTLIFEQSEFAVLCALKAIFLSQTNPSRSRGVIILLTGTLILLAFDHDDLKKVIIIYMILNKL